MPGVIKLSVSVVVPVVAPKVIVPPEVGKAEPDQFVLALQLPVPSPAPVVQVAFTAKAELESDTNKPAARKTPRPSRPMEERKEVDFINFFVSEGFCC